MQKYIPKEVEEKARKKWAKTKKSADLKKSDKKFYLLVEFTYPSGDLHMGHWFAFAVPDILARLKCMQGYEVFAPNGFDAFGLPAENAAIKRKIHPRDWTLSNIEKMREQFESMGAIYDWDHMVITCEPEYYKWNQWIFLKMYEKGLAYRGKTLSNWCPVDKTVLANENVENGKCWRCGAEVVQKEVEQWFFKITEYADKLLWTDEPKADWPKPLREGQNNWIGKSEGALIKFPIAESATNYVLLHGYTGSPKNNFFPWVKKELEAGGAKVYAPQMPEEETSTIEDRVESVLKSAEFNENTVLLGHSLGSVVALKVVERLKKPIKKLILAAGFMQGGFLDHERPFEKLFDWQFDVEKIKKNVGEIVILRASNDTAVPQERAEYIQSQIGGRIVDFTAEDDHITAEVEPIVLQNLRPSIEVFTTRPDTLFGATFLVLAPEHPLVASIKAKEITNYVEKSKKKSELERKENKEKTGVFSGIYAKNPINNEQIPIWIADYVLWGYGTGAIMAVPAHDERDFEFATKYKLPIKTVIQAKSKTASDKAYVGEGQIINSSPWNGWNTPENISKVIDFLEEKELGKRKVQYHLHDWSVSRQRYWGTPIPMIHCPKCGIVPVPEKDLPVELPYNVDFAPKGKPPLATAEEWVNVKCPNCTADAKREVETMDTFVDSSWYFLRYLDPKNSKELTDKALVKDWMPIDIYFGGAEHTLGHTLYSRFFVKFLQDIGAVPQMAEYANRRVHHGVILGPDGHRMSKSHGNVVNPDDEVGQYGADAVRLYLAFLGPYDLVAPWDPGGIRGVYNFLTRVWKLQEAVADEQNHLESEDLLWMNKTIKKVGDDIESNKFNTGVSSLMEWLNYLSKKAHSGKISKEEYETFIKLLAPYAPHITEELWETLGKGESVHQQKWPVYDEKYIKSQKTTLVVQVNGKVRDKAIIDTGTTQADAEKVVITLDNVKKYLEGKTPKKIIFVKDKLINLVI